jgi:hypothetical protein
MKKALLLLMLAFYFDHNQAQTLAKNDPLKLDADFYLMEKDFSKALNIYLSILRSEPENADIKYKAGLCYLYSEDEKAKAIPLLEEATQKISEKYSESSFKETNAPIEALFLMGSAYRVNNQLDKAIESYRQYRNYLDPKDDYNLKLIDQYIRNCEFAKSLQNDPVTMGTRNLGPVVNTAAPNFNAVVSGDGETLFYTSPGRQGYEIFITTMTDSIWATPRNLTSVLGTGKYMKTSDLSYDGQTLILALDNPVNADLFVSRFIKGKWTKVESLGKEINSKYNETHGSLSVDGRTLYFTSDRKGGVGDLDIYTSVLDEKGVWGKPVNLGSSINTPFNEETPFISETGEILYFSSEGHDGMGGYDIFYYDFSNVSEGVKNAGYPLNTTDNDLFYAPVENGTSGYYAFAGKDSYGGRDIYRVTIDRKVEVPEVADEVMRETEPELFVADEPVQVPDTATVAAIPDPEPFIESDPVLPVEPAISEPPVEEITPEPVPEPVTEIQEPEPASVETLAEPEFIAAEPIPDETTTYAATASSELANASSYRVQIMALRKAVDLSYFRNLSGISLVYKNDQWYRYTVGNTTNREEAQNILADLVSKGYSDAFIRGALTNPQYTIQVMAVPGPVVDLSLFSRLSEITVTRGEDNFCRYTTGEYSTREEALQQLDNVKVLGFSGAFVTRVK